MFLRFILYKSNRKVRPFDTGPDPKHRECLKSQKPGKGDALRKEQAFLHTFVAGQKYGVGRDATRRFCCLGFLGKEKGQQINPLLPSLSLTVSEVLCHWLKFVAF